MESHRRIAAHFTKEIEDLWISVGSIGGLRNDPVAFEDQITPLRL